jgi:hypothetical protein
MADYGTCPRCGGNTISTARQDDICLNDSCGYAGYYYRTIEDTENEEFMKSVERRNSQVDSGGSYYDD